MPVSLEHDGSVAVIGLDDGKANALTHEVLAAIDDGLTRASDDGAAAVLLAGRTGRFSAGFDLSVMTAGEEQMRGLVTAGAELLMRLFTFPAPVVVACTGHALAAGALLLLAGDVRIGAAGDYKLGLNEVAIGMGLPAFAIEMARYRLTPGGFNAALLGEVYPPDVAAAVGYLDRVVAADDVVDEASRTARRLAELRTGAVSHSKQLARAAIAQRIRDGLSDDLASVSGPNPRS
ncbi:MAG TPA: crotonase/enoyl-CoA hydratase family protein [Acidimicrobiales bacterium]